MISPRPCSVCGASFIPRRKSTACLCSSACKQRAYRGRRVTDSHQPHLTFELREALRHEVDRRRRAGLVEAEREETEQLLAMFADERSVT
jgi:hypothetical protein